MERAVGGNGSVDVVMADYTLGGTKAEAVIANRFSLPCNYELNLTDSNGNVIETLASGTIDPYTAKVISGTPPVGGTNNRYIQARVWHPSFPGMEAKDSSWAAASIDSDGDGITDKDEKRWGLDPLDPTDALQDNDGDGLTNIDEINVYFTDPLVADTDGDSILDGAEIANNLDPNDASDAGLDPDRDFLTNAEEINTYGSDPFVADPGLAPDTDGDGVNDKLELALGMDPADPKVSSVGSDTPEDQKVMHVLNRLTFGPTNDLVVEIRQKGVSAWIAEQLTPIGLDEVPPDPAQELMDSYYYRGNQADRLAAIRPVHSLKQLQTKMARFWANHFSTALVKTEDEYELFEDDQFFVNAFGNFRALLGISAKSPAMMEYLDLNGSKVGAPNENYAREVMELHTLGVTSTSGLYGPLDIAENARILTGWALGSSSQNSRYGEYTPQGTVVYRSIPDFVFNSGDHDYDPKTFLGESYPAPGETGLDEGERMLTTLATHDSTADFICTKLAQYFVSDTPSPNTVADCAAKFLATSDAPDQMALVLDKLFNSVEFNSSGTYRAKFKDNQEFMFSLARLLGRSAVGNQQPGNPLNDDALGAQIAQTGQGLYAKGEPTGWPEVADHWINANAALNRFREANQMVFDTTRTTNFVDYFTNLNLTTSGEVIGHLFLLMLGGQYDVKDMEMAYWVLHPNHQPFALTDTDAESKLRNLIARIAQLPEYSLH